MFREAHFGGNSWERHGSDSCTSQGGGSLRAGVWGGVSGQGHPGGSWALTKVLFLDLDVVMWESPL